MVATQVVRSMLFQPGLIVQSFSIAASSFGLASTARICVPISGDSSFDSAS